MPVGRADGERVRQRPGLLHVEPSSPQAADNNQGVWASFETYCRSLAQAGNERLITWGPGGFDGARSSSGKVAIPIFTWKIAVVVPAGPSNALSRSTTATSTGASLGPIDLAGIPALQNVGPGTHVAFRIVTFSVEVSSGLATPWTTNGSTVELSSPSRVRFQDDTPVASAATRLMRLRVSRP